MPLAIHTVPIRLPAPVFLTIKKVVTRNHKNGLSPKTFAEFARLALHHELARSESHAIPDPVDFRCLDAFGMWKKRMNTTSGVAYVRSIRRAWRSRHKV